MALISPGVEVTIIDQSTYQPTAAGTVAYVLLATAQDKQNPAGSTATYTTKANADKVFAISSQRELVSYYGMPKFQVDATGTPIHANELNEYGLLAAYSALGVANRVIVQRADVDLSQLTGTSIRPTGQPNDGTYWLDLTNTNWGVYEWQETGFVLQTPIIINSKSDLASESTVPLTRIGKIGDYAVVPYSTSNPIYYKNYDNAWVLVGSDSWKSSVPAIQGATPGTINNTLTLNINGVNVNMTSTTITQAAKDINDSVVLGITAGVNAAGQILLYANASAKSDGSTTDGKIKITNMRAFGLTTDAATQLGLFTAAEIASGNIKTINGPTLTFAPFNSVPAWRTSDATPRPYGSIWLKTSATGNGASYALKEYSGTSVSWKSLGAPLYASDTDAIAELDKFGGGANIKQGSLYVKYNATGGNTATFKPYIKNVAGILTIQGNASGGSSSYSSSTFTMEVSYPAHDAGSPTTVTKTITIGAGASATSFVANVLAANFNNISASLEGSSGNQKITIKHEAGGTIKFTNLTGNAVVQSGLINDSHIQTITDGAVWLASPYTALYPYTHSLTAPYNNPADGQYWYYNNALEVDILYNNGAAWVGYGVTSTDARGYDLSRTNPTGPILSASKPTEQIDATPLVAGDLWIDTGDLENYPVIYRYNDLGTWDLIDNGDQVSANGIVFGDARWSTDGNADPITDSLPSITDLLTVSNLDPDAPAAGLYARGTLLFNTRRSGYGIKSFQSTAFSNYANPPSVVATWVSHEGRDEMGVPYFGHKAQRSVIVTALKAAIASSVALREEQVQFNLVVCPGYPELISDMIQLNNDRKNTAFVIGDSPLTLNSSTASLTAWASNQNLALDNGENGLVSTSEYLGVYYPSGLATNLDGTSVVVPPSHAMLRTFIRSDNVSYPWFAPAGVRRGVVDNITSIGYVDTTNNHTFHSIGVTVGLRDTLYEQRVNPLTVLPGVGLVAYGQKTRAALTSAMDRINVARLVCYLRLVLDGVARPFVFEPNDTITRNQVKAAFESVLNDVVAKRGIYDYLVVCDTTNNTPDRIDRNELWVDIAIEPVKAIEFIYIPVRLKNTGAIAKGL